MSSAAVATLVQLVTDLEREADRHDLPPNLRRLARVGHERMTALLEAVRSGDDFAVDEVVNGTFNEDGSRRKDGLHQVLPYWARGTELLRELATFIDVDETQTPVAVTVHWERIPAKRRAAAASLASEMVDTYRGRKRSGRPRKSGKTSPKTG